MSDAFKKITSGGTVLLGRFLAIGISSALTVLIGVYFIVEMSVGTLHHRIDDTNQRIDNLRAQLQREMDIRLQRAAFEFDALPSTEFASVISERIRTDNLFVAGVTDPLNRIAVVSIGYEGTPVISLARYHKDTGETFFRFRGAFYSLDGSPEPSAADQPSSHADLVRYRILSWADLRAEQMPIVEVQTPADGVVSSVEADASGLIRLTVSHEFGIETRYILDSTQRIVGERVSRTDVVGTRRSENRLSELVEAGEITLPELEVRVVRVDETPQHSWSAPTQLTGSDLEEFRSMLDTTGLQGAVSEIFDIV